MKRGIVFPLWDPFRYYRHVLSAGSAIFEFCPSPALRVWYAGRAIKATYAVFGW